jgi:uncharacterized protein (TIGR00290 family)
MTEPSERAGLANKPVRGVPVFCSWSGGKDSALALHEAVAQGARPRLLISMMTEGGQRSRSHGLSREVLRAQAGHIGLPIRFWPASWDSYEATFHAAVADAVASGPGLGVFGDLDIEDHRNWVEQQCASAGAASWLPLWKRDHRRAVRDLLDAGFRARIIAVRAGSIPCALLGRSLDDDVLNELDRGADLAGENGEYHTVVTAGPLFGGPLHLAVGESSLRDGMWFLDAAVNDSTPMGAR